MTNYYTYLYRNPETQEPFYVGMGKRNRKFDHLKEAKTRPEPTAGEHKLNTIRKILANGKEPIIEIVKDNITREEAVELEIQLIARYGRKDNGTGILTNQTDGGDGTRGWSQEAKLVVSERNRKLGITPPAQKGRKQNRDPKFNMIPARVVSTGEKIKAAPNDIRWGTGEIVGINKGVVQDSEWRKKNAEGVSKLKWWNNGSKCIRSVECPGVDYVLGRGKVKW